MLNILGRISYSPQHPAGNSLVSEGFARKLRGTPSPSILPLPTPARCWFLSWAPLPWLPRAGGDPYYTLLMAGSVAGPILAGRLSDMLGRRRLAIITCLISIFSVAALFGSGKNMAPLVMSAIFMGLVVYSQIMLVQTPLADVTSRDTRDMAYSVFFTVSCLAGAVWTFAVGICVDSFGFGGAFSLMSFSYLAGAADLLKVRPGQMTGRPADKATL